MIYSLSQYWLKSIDCVRLIVYGLLLTAYSVRQDSNKRVTLHTLKYIKHCCIVRVTSRGRQRLCTH